MLVHKPIRQIRLRRMSKCPIPKSTFTTYMDEGVMHYRAGHYRKSLFCFDRAIEMQPTNKNALVNRSQCHLKLGDAAAALKDAEASFDRSSNDDNFVRGLYQYAESLFSLGQFEKALIAYQRGFRRRRDMDGFRIGVQKSRQAIFQAIGDCKATQIEDLDEILPLMIEMHALINAKEIHCCIRPGSDNHKKKPTKLKKPSKSRQHWVAREILGSMYFDKKYLTRLLNRPDVKSEQGLSHLLRGHATEALNYLKIRERFWRQQKPIYSRKIGLNFNNNMVLRYEELERIRKEASRKIKQEASLGAVLKNMALIEHSMSLGRAKDCQLECERTLRQLKEMNTNLLPRKPEFMCRILHLRGLALSKLKNYDGAVGSFQQELQIATDNKMADFKASALDALGRAFALKKSYSEAAEAWEHRIISSKDPLERAYLSHEIGRCYFEQYKLDVAQFFAEQCLEEAKKINDDIWIMNAELFLGQINVRTMNLSSALHHFETSEHYANKLGNTSNATLLRDASQCLKVWIERREQEALEQARSNSNASIHEHDSEEAFDDIEANAERAASFEIESRMRKSITARNRVSKDN